MLNIYYGNLEEEYPDPPSYFDTTYDEDWFNQDLVKQMIKDIDKSEVISPYCIQSPILGQIAPYFISGGVKTLILMYNEPENIFTASGCGDNCVKWILKIAEEKDITITLQHMMDFGKEKFIPKVKILNNNQIVRNYMDMIDIGIELLSKAGY